MPSHSHAVLAAPLTPVSLTSHAAVLGIMVTVALATPTAHAPAPFRATSRSQNGAPGLLQGKYPVGSVSTRGLFIAYAYVLTHAIPTGGVIASGAVNLPVLG